MELTIDGKKYEFNFGIGFLHKLDKDYGMNQNGIKLGMGLMALYPSLQIKADPIALETILRYAAKPAISEDKLDEYLDSADIGKLFDEVKKAIDESNAAGFMVKKLAQIEKGNGIKLGK